jgi:tetratricopeptide (TPR) repeat protein
VVATLVHRLVDGWPSYPAAPALLARVAASAASAGQWPIAHRAYEALSARYRGSPIASTAGVDLAETLVRAGARTEARAYLEDAVAGGGDTAPRALLLLAGIEEALGNRREALVAYDRVLREHPRVERSVSSLLSHAQLLESSGQPDGARSLLQRIVDASDGEVAGEASYRIAGILSAQGQEAAAVEWYMTAAYVAEGSRWERPSLLGAVRSFTALDRTHEALIAYRKAMARPTAVGPRDAMPEVSASPALAQRQGGDGIGDVSLRLAEALRRAGDHQAALEMYLTVARLTAGGPAAPRALLGAIRSLVAVGNRTLAEAIYRRLLESGDTDPALLAEARKTIRGIFP